MGVLDGIVHDDHGTEGHGHWGYRDLLMDIAYLSHSTLTHELRTDVSSSVASASAYVAEGDT